MNREALMLKLAFKLFMFMYASIGWLGKYNGPPCLYLAVNKTKRKISVFNCKQVSSLKIEQLLNTKRRAVV